MKCWMELMLDFVQYLSIDWSYQKCVHSKKDAWLWCPIKIHRTIILSGMLYGCENWSLMFREEQAEGVGELCAEEGI